MDTITSSDSPISQQFCAFCLREKLPGIEFYKHIVGCSVEQQKWLHIILGYDFQLQNFAICKPCWEIMQLIQDFRLRCLKANSLVERIGAGLRSDDGWFSVRNLATIESIRMIVKNQLLQFETVDIRVKVKQESDGDQQHNQSGTEEASEEILMSTLDIGEVKVEHSGEDSDKETNQCVETSDAADGMPMVSIYSVQIKSDPDAENINAFEQPSSPNTIEMVTESDAEESIASEANNLQVIQNVNRDSLEAVLESIIEISEVKIEPEVEHKEQPLCMQSVTMEAESDDESADQSALSNQQGTSGLVQCKKCSRVFKPKGYRVHIRRCDGKIPDSIFECPLCPITFKSLYKLNVHVNKHIGKTPYKCRKHCNNEFFSSDDLRRHELKCGKFQCTLCDKIMKNRKGMNDHYIQEHPGERRFPCSQCDKRFINKRLLKRHEQMHTPEGPVKPHICNECNKSFADRSKLTKHMLTHTGWKQFQCEHCDRQLKHRGSLKIHLASKHPELATESARKNLARMRERWRKRKLERKQEDRRRISQTNS